MNIFATLSIAGVEVSMEALSICDISKKKIIREWMEIEEEEVQTGLVHEDMADIESEVQPKGLPGVHAGINGSEDDGMSVECAPAARKERVVDIFWEMKEVFFNANIFQAEVFLRQAKCKMNAKRVGAMATRHDRHSLRSYSRNQGLNSVEMLGFTPNFS